MPLTFDDPSIIFDVNKGTILEASAGSGKTTILTERWVASFLYLLIYENKSISEAFHSIVALTFTKKAATEMKIRIRKRLEELWDGGELDYFLDQLEQFCGTFPVSKNEIMSYLADIREQINDLLPSLSITTISAFILQALYTNSLDLSFDIGTPEDQGYNVSITEQESQTQLLQGLLSKYYHNHPAQKHFEIGVSLCGLTLWNQIFTQLRTFISDFGTRAIEKSLEDSSYLQWKDFIAEVVQSDNPKQKIWTRLEQSRDEFLAVLEQERLQKSNGKLTSTNESLYQNLKKIEADTLTELFFPSLIGNYKIDKLVKNEDVNALRAESEAAYRRFIDVLYRLMMPLLLPVSELCDVILKEKQQENQEISFSESELLFLDSLNQSHFLKKIQSRIRFFFADEYQDTSDLQKEIFDLILSNDRITPFFVGDPKQSIYSFRKANVYVFQKTVQEFQDKGHMVKYLNTNYRSAKSYVDIVNRLFGDIFGKDQSGIVYHDQQSNNNDHGEFTYTLALGTDEDTKVIKADAEDKSFKDALIIIDEMLKSGIQAHEIMVLFHRNRHIIKFYYLIKKYYPDLPISSSIKNLLWDSEYLSSLMSFLRAIIRPYHNLTMVELLKTPFFRKTDDEITTMLSQCRLQQKSLYDMLNLTDRKILDDLILLKDRISIEEFINIVIKRLAYEEFLLSFQNAGDALATLRLFVDEAKNINQKRSMNLAEFVQFIDNKKPQIYESEFSGEDGDTLRLMTLHSSKGLESPYVVYVHSANTKEKNTRHSLYQKGLLAFTVFGRGQIAQSVDDFYKIDNTSEEKRLAYVALTRAKKRFVYCGLSSGFKKGVAFQTQWESFLNKELVENVLQNDAKCLDLPDIFKHKHSQNTRDSFEEYQKRFDSLQSQKQSFEELPQFLSVSLLLDAEFAPDQFYDKYRLHSFDILEKFQEISEDHSLSLTQADEGALVHELLQKFDAPSFEQAKRYLETHHLDKNAVFASVLDYAFSYWDSPFYQEVLRNSPVQDKERQVVCLIKENIIVRSTADTYISSDQGHMIVDYKLSVSPKNLERYSRQISYYALLSEKSGHPVDKIFLFNIKEGKEIEIPWDKNQTEQLFDKAVDNALILLKEPK